MSRSEPKSGCLSLVNRPPPLLSINVNNQCDPRVSPQATRPYWSALTEATAIRVRRRVLGDRSFGVFIVSNGTFPPRGQEEAQCWPKGLSIVMELTMGCITCCWEMKLKRWPDRDRSPRPVHVHEGGKEAELPLE